MHMMRRLKSIASGRSSVSDPVRTYSPSSFFFFFKLLSPFSCFVLNCESNRFVKVMEMKTIDVVDCFDLLL